MEKYALIRKKRDQSISKRFEKINRRTFPPSIFQLNSIIAAIDTPDIIEPDIIEPIIEPDIIEPIIEPILLIEKQFETVNLLIEKEELIQDIIIEQPAEIIPDIINPNLIAQAEELRKLILLQETIKRFSKKKIV